MKAFSVQQPYAGFFVALNRSDSTPIKQWETGRLKTNYRGPIVICSSRVKSAKINRELREKFADLINQSHLNQLITSYAGSAIAIADLVDCLPITQELIDQQTELEKRVGFWVLGDRTKYAWKLENVRRIPVRGQLGIYNLPYEIEIA